MEGRNGSSVTVLLPALNEENGIGEVIDSLPREQIENAGYGLKVLVVDGNSTDRTIEIAKERGAEVVLQDGKGKGHGVRAGFISVDTDYLIMMDADGTYPSENIPDFLEHLSNGADVVMGSRLLGSIAEGSMTDLNRAGNRLLSFMATTLYGMKTTDLCTGMWGFKRRAIEAIELNSSGFEIESEMFAQSVKAGLAIHEVPINYSTREGETKLGSLRCGIRIALKLLRKRFVR